MITPDESVDTAATLRLWATISRILWWTVLLIAFASLPILGEALYMLMQKYRKSNYFLFLTSMVILDLLMLLSILFNLISDYSFTWIKGLKKILLLDFFLIHLNPELIQI